MADDYCDFMDIDDEYILQDITSQIVEFRKDNVLEAHYESPLTTQESTSKQVPGNSVVVVDTNFLISHLGFLKTLIFEHAKKYQLLIIIPWIVLQELDGLKSARKKNSSSSRHEVGNLAQTAIKFLHNCLINREGGLRGQKIDERIEKAEDNDDKILDCCRYFQMVSQCSIVLLSNDKNLCVKAMVHDIITASHQKSGGLDSALEKILSKKTISDETIYLQSNEAIPWKNFSNEPNTITKPKDKNENLGSGFVQDADAMMMDCDDTPPNFSSPEQNQAPTFEMTTVPTQKSHNPEYSSLYDSIHSPKNKGGIPTSNPSPTVSPTKYSANPSLYNSVHAPKNKGNNSICNSSSTVSSVKYSTIKNNYSSLDDSIHAPKNKGMNSTNEVSNNNNNSGLVSQGAISQILSDRRESIGTSTIYEKRSYVPECILLRKIESSQENLVTKIVSNLNNFLPPAISFHFQQCFDDHWTYVVKDPQPWSLSTMLKFMERYWFTVFSEVFQGINIEPIKNMISFISRWENYKHTRRANFTIGDVMQFVENSEIIFMMVFVGIQWNNESAIESKPITKNWWSEFEYSLTMIN